jgi:hypothetical protein
MNEYHKINSVFKRDAKGKFTNEFSLPEFGYLANNEWIFEEKIDGTNIRVMWNGINIKYGGKTDKESIPANLTNRLNDLFLAKQVLFEEKFGLDTQTCLYGEGFGKGIQKGDCYLKDSVDFILFDVKIGRWWLKREDVREIANCFNIRYAPELAAGSLYYGINLIQKGLVLSFFGNFVPEGFVMRPRIDLFARNGERIITKIKHKDFL